MNESMMPSNSVLVTAVVAMNHDQGRTMCKSILGTRNLIFPECIEIPGGPSSNIVRGKALKVKKRIHSPSSSRMSLTASNIAQPALYSETKS